MFDVAEVNVSFYHPPKPEVAESWCDLLDRLDATRFRFTVKLWQGLTHGADSIESPEACRLRESCELLRARGRLSAVLAQFPWSFKNAPASRDRLRDLADQWGEFNLAVEVRHGSWAEDSYLDWLRAQSIAFVNIDQPVIGESLEPSGHITSPAVAYVRLHGRNREAWFSEEAGRDERYNYRYTASELAPWVARIEELSAVADETIVITNNHFQGQAVTNALELQAATVPNLEVPVPRTLTKRCPDLCAVPGLRLAEDEEFTLPPPAEEQESGVSQLQLF
jgi:uncharacterized protein YecE (DUF72 family)